MALNSSRILIRGKESYDQMVGPASAWVDLMPQYRRKVELRTVGNITTIYKGWSLFGTLDATAEWMLQQIIIDVTTELDVTEGLAGGNPAQGNDPFNFTWTGRAGHAYS